MTARLVPSLRDQTHATMIYVRLRNVEMPSQILSADKWGIPKANRAQTDPEIAIK